MKNIQAIETIIATLNPLISFDDMVAAVNQVIPITDEEMFTLSEDSMVIRNFVDAVGY